MHFLYLLKSDNHCRTYVGISADVEKRLSEHNRGKVRSTKAYYPYSLIYKEDFLTKTDARKREIELKTNSSKKEMLFKSLKLM